ncbi:hypothetical protein AWB81_07956 [Caballeronia arationis]|uniref:DUF2382 domain-containing protein n=1 Tax=Caballeronia arationis TaxID=1777142 RepID=UPI00074C32FB|nr:DUF2382 domain-containing protein [Caballeronia arationis]SAL07198.1 hypothetical protein AWB81_07956 [Caballeronia arationis]
MNVNGASDQPEDQSVPASVPAPGADVTVSAIQEELTVGTVEAQTGAIRVRKVVSDETRPISIELRTETVGVTRVSINRPVEAEDGPRQEAVR